METKVSTKDLRVGMFVADLDRPWVDTPFLLQGFVIEDAAHIEALRDHCHYVIVDGARSTGAEYIAPPPGSTPTPRAPSAPSSNTTTTTQPKESGRPIDVPPEPERPRPTRPDGARAMNLEDVLRRNRQARPGVSLPHEDGAEGGEGFLGRAMGRLRGLFGGADRAGDATKPELPPVVDESPQEFAARAALLPPGVAVQTYRDLVPVEVEVARAREVVQRTTEILEKLVNDIRLGNLLEIEDVQEVVHEMVESIVRNPDALMWVARLRETDITTYGHGLQVAVYLTAFGRQLGFPKPQLAQLGQVGLLLDIGKIRLPRELLEKQGRLSPEEFEAAKTHVQHGLDILSSTPNFDAEVIEGIAQHHERWNGSGYLEGRAAESITLYGRMAGIADCFAAITKRRPYAEAVSSYEAMRSLTNWSGEYFHEALVQQFISSVGVFPVGSLIELSTGEVAIVVAHNKVRRLKPKVLVVTGPDKTPVGYPSLVDLLYDPKSATDQPIFIRRGLAAGAHGLDLKDFYLA